MQFLTRNLFKCRHFEVNSDLLLIESGFLRMWNFSVEHRLQNLSPALKEFDRVITFQFMLWSISLSFSSQTNFDSSVLSRYFEFLKLCW